MGAKWAAFTQPKQLSLPGNDKSHNFTDPNKGGGPAAPVVRNAKKVPPASRGGAYQSGVRQYANTSIRGTRGGSGNPASRGGKNVEARGQGAGATSETRVPGHGGSPQTRSNIPAPANRGGFGHSGQQNVPNYGPTNPKPGSGNLRGKMYTRISGRFKQDTKGARATGVIGDYGRNPITANT